MTGDKKWRIGLYYILLLAAVMAGTMFLGVAAVVLFKHFGVIQSDESGYSIALVTTIVISVIVTFFAAVMLGKNIITPVTKLSELSSRVAKGDFNATLDAKSYIDEIQTVINSFNAMVKELGTNEALSNDFVTNVSHEFKTPIAAIEGYATLLQDKSLTDEEKDEYIEKILFNSKRLSELTGNILLLSKLETQNIITDKTWFRLDEQIRQSILTLENRWSKKGITFNIGMEEVWYYASEGLFSTVWTNIIGNAVKYSKDDSEIDITLEKGEDFVTVTVTDDGIGMSGDTLSHIFDKFYQGDLSHRSEGNGLGLTLVRRILDLCNGRAEVKSEPGAGTEFTVFLPAEKAE
ncbi:MAG: HAMP domain-containing sensor histidine kinase [Eubacteriales bacterium]|nr:HAMP domain-containing sensor histidine kinase [Eubacteriales bacterium]